MPHNLVNIIKNKYPTINFKIYTAINFSTDSFNITLKKNEYGMKSFDIEYLKYLNIDINEYPEEYERYNILFDKNNFYNTDNINIIYLE